MTSTKAGQGVPTSFSSPVEGSLCQISGASDVIALLGKVEIGEVVNPIALVRDAGGTTIGPLLADLTAVVSTAGGLGSHIALLCNEFGCPCVVAAEFEVIPSDRTAIRVDPDGGIWIVGEP
jgi:phosphohistidine swiveling domain-containing protein